MYTERDAIKDELFANRAEIQLLRERNLDLLNRLRELDERDQDVMRFKESTKVLDRKVQEQNYVIPPVAPEEGIKEKLEQVEKEKEKQEENADLVLVSRKGAMIKLKEILKEKGEMKVRDLEDELYKRTGKTYVDFTAFVKAARSKYPEITKVGYGTYGYDANLEKTDSDSPVAVGSPVTVSKEGAMYIVKEILEEKGEMKALDLEKELYHRTGKMYHNFYHFLQSVMRKYPEIKKVGRGKYDIKVDPPMIKFNDLTNPAVDLKDLKDK